MSPTDAYRTGLHHVATVLHQAAGGPGLAAPDCTLLASTIDSLIGRQPAPLHPPADHGARLFPGDFEIWPDQVQRL